MNVKRLLTDDVEEDDGLGLVLGVAAIGTSAGVTCAALYFLGVWLTSEPGRMAGAAYVLIGAVLIVAALRRAR